MDKNQRGTGKEIDQNKSQGHSNIYDLINKIVDNKVIKYIINILLIIILICITVLAIYSVFLAIKSGSKGTGLTVGPVQIPEDPYLEINITNTYESKISTYGNQFTSITTPSITQTKDNYITPTPPLPPTQPTYTRTLSTTSTPDFTTMPTIYSQDTSASPTPAYEILNPCAKESLWIFNQDYLELTKQGSCLDNLNKYGFYPSENGIHINLTTVEGNNIYSISRPIINKNWTIQFELKPNIYYGARGNDDENVGHENSAIFYVGLYNSDTKKVIYRLINIKNALEDNEYNIWIASNKNFNTLAKNEKIYVECRRKDASVECSLKYNEDKLNGYIDLDLINNPFDHLLIGFDMIENTTIDIYLDSLIIEYN
jgi:hypothetical protein